MPDELLARIQDGEALVEELGDELLAELREDGELWPITALSLAAHARSHHRALLAGLEGPAPRAAQVHARPIVETMILIDYLAENPGVRVWIWVADALKKQRTMVREWREAVEAGVDDDASVNELTELIERKSAEIAEAEEEARKAAAERGEQLESVELPKTYAQAKRDPQLFSWYTKGFRHLSGLAHVAATLFTVDRYGEEMTLLDDSLRGEDGLAVRALAAGVLAIVYAEAARAISRDDLVEKTGAVHTAMAGV